MPTTSDPVSVVVHVPTENGLPLARVNAVSLTGWILRTPAAPDLIERFRIAIEEHGAANVMLAVVAALVQATSKRQE